MAYNFGRKAKLRKGVEKNRSGFEDTILDELRAAKVPYEYEPKDKHLSYAVPRQYIPDVVLTNKKTGRQMFIELKGFFMTDDLSKMAAVAEQNPDKDIRFVFMSANTAVQGARVRKKCGTKMSNGEWATLHNFKFAEKHIPQEWLDELTTK